MSDLSVSGGNAGSLEKEGVVGETLVSLQKIDSLFFITFTLHTKQFNTNMNNTTENTTLNATENTTLNATENTTLNATENTTLNPSDNTTLNPSENTTLNATENTTLNPSDNTTLNPSDNSYDNSAINAILYDIFNHSQHNLLSHSDILPLPLLHAFASYFANLLLYSNLILPSQLKPFIHFALSSHSLLLFHSFQPLFLHNFFRIAFQGTCGSLGRTLPFSEKSKYNRQIGYCVI